MLKKRSQAWGIDITIAVVIFIVGLVTVYIYSINLSAEAKETLDNLNYEGNLVTSTLLLDGAPLNWQELDKDSILILGLTENGKIKEEKIARFEELLNEDAAYVKAKLNTRYDFCIKIVGWSSDNFKCTNTDDSPPENPENLVRIERFVAYNNKPAKMEFYIWN